jgi:hypothetical protein
VECPPVTLETPAVIVIIITTTTTLASRRTAMTMKTNNDKRTTRWSRQQSCNVQSTENGNHTEETQHGPTPIPPNIGLTNDAGNKCNKRIRWSKEEMKEVVWCFMYRKAFSRFFTKKSCTRNITHCKESATIRNLKLEWWDSPLVQEENYQEKPVKRK